MSTYTITLRGTNRHLELPRIDDIIVQIECDTSDLVSLTLRELERDQEIIKWKTEGRRTFELNFPIGVAPFLRLGLSWEGTRNKSFKITTKSFKESSEAAQNYEVPLENGKTFYIVNGVHKE